MDQEVKEVTAAVQNYVKAVTDGDTALLRSVFRGDAHMWGYLGSSLISLPIEEFIDIVAKAPDPASWVDGYSHAIRSVEVTGDVAVAVLEETGYIGGNFTNYFSLLREDGRWAIAGKTFFLTGGQAPPVS
jgi:Putative lumazine-binding